MNLLNEIQQKLKVPKGQYNSFSKFYYRNAEDILEAVKPLLGKGTMVLEDEMVQLGDRFYVKAKVSLTDDKGTTWFSSAYAREAADKKGMDEAQITGAASSYARKYALNGLFCIDDTKDADNEDNTKEEPKAVKTKPKVGVERPKNFAKSLITELAKDLGYELKKDNAGATIKELTGLELQEANFDNIIEKLRAKIEEKEAFPDGGEPIEKEIS